MPTSRTASRTAAAPHGLPTSLRVGVMRLARRLRQEGAREDVTPTQLAALATVDVHGPLTLGELAAAERVQPPSMSRSVASLEAAGLVSREPAPADGRSILLTITPAGRATLTSIRRRRDAWLEQQLRSLPAEDLAVLRAAAVILERLAGS